MPSAHKAFEALGPINWDDIIQDQLDTFLKTTFSDAQSIVDSIPASLTTSQKLSRQRSATDTDLPSLPDRIPKTSDVSAQLKKEWKEIKVNPRENPLGIDVYKLSAKDGKGAWFARRSLHDGLTFEKWKLGMEKELDESMKVQGKPGDGSIRGIGADKRVVNETVENRGKVQVYQLSAQFPGPTTPRDFITLLLSTDSAIDTPGTPRHFMLVSKPCIHPECPPRQGYIRGQYESVEYIREIKVEKPLRKTRSSIDLTNEDSVAAVRSATENLSREATIRSAHQAAPSASPFDDDSGRRRGKTVGAVDSVDGRSEDDNYETLVEWMMVTRSDPGGSVPRFMIERGTPPGIAGDANKFVKWITSKSIDGFTEDDNEDKELKRQATEAEAVVHKRVTPSVEPTPNLFNGSSPIRRPTTEKEDEVEEQNPTGFYGIIANALNAAASVAASHIPNPFGSVKGGDTDLSDLSSDPPEDDASSFHSFHSVENEENEIVDDTPSSKLEDSLVLTPSHGGGASSHSTESLTARSAHHEKELRKLEDRKRKMEEKLQRAQERALAKRGNGDDNSSREEAAVQKLREKHEREVAKQQEKYQRELKKLEAKRASEQKKAEERRKKTLEREEKGNLAMELDKVRAERDIARKQIEILKEQVGDLQAQNTTLVARLGREGINVDIDDVASSGGSSVSGARRSTTMEKSQLLAEHKPRRAETMRS